MTVALIIVAVGIMFFLMMAGSGLEEYLKNKGNNKDEPK